jgi:hypothetical protein
MSPASLAHKRLPNTRLLLPTAICCGWRSLRERFHSERLQQKRRTLGSVRVSTVSWETLGLAAAYAQAERKEVTR